MTPGYFIDTHDLPSKEIVQGFHGRFIHGDGLSIAYWDVQAGATIPVHHHIHEMMVNVIEGTLELTIGNETRRLSAGMVGVIPGNVPHTAKAITPCKLIDVFHPVREDYR
jgi:quercetin dioxygenase-like cupin family protein